MTHAAIDMICALMHPLHDDYDLRQEQLNKSSLLQTKSFLESLLNMWTVHVVGISGCFCAKILTFVTVTGNGGIGGLGYVRFSHVRSVCTIQRNN